MQAIQPVKSEASSTASQSDVFNPGMTKETVFPEFMEGGMNSLSFRTCYPVASHNQIRSAGSNDSFNVMFDETLMHFLSSQTGNHAAGDNQERMRTTNDMDSLSALEFDNNLDIPPPDGQS